MLWPTPGQLAAMWQNFFPAISSRNRPYHSMRVKGASEKDFAASFSPHEMAKGIVFAEALILPKPSVAQVPPEWAETPHTRFGWFIAKRWTNWLPAEKPCRNILSRSL